jgi:hypothetical protein
MLMPAVPRSARTASCAFPGAVAFLPAMRHAALLFQVMSSQLRAGKTW